MMASLFKNNVLKERLMYSIVPKLEERMAIVQQWHKALRDKSLLKKTETQCEQAFNDDFFVKILGYSRFPSEKYTIEVKAATDMAGGQKPDAALGFFGSDGNRVQCVCEIKDANTPLDKPQQREGNLTPVQQGFKYKPLYKNCGFVVVTNFREIRLYRDTLHDFEKFTLEELADPANDYGNFRKFFYLLSADHFIAESGKSETEELLAAIRIEQEQITKDFYKEYRELRLQLIGNIRKNNPVLSFDVILEKAQKILDRMVFIVFCEDRGLLPENKLSSLVHGAEKEGLGLSIWSLMREYFLAVDRGNLRMEVEPDGYNGELFKSDPVLDSLQIDDNVCKEIVRLGNFNYNDDLPVNILGHIFEQSITDIEELKSQHSNDTVIKPRSKRKKDGIYYTPEYIVDFIVSSTLGKHLEEIEGKMLQKHDVKQDIKDKTYQKRAVQAYTEYQHEIGKITVLDLACGSGAFLVKVFDFLKNEHERVAQILEELTGIHTQTAASGMVRTLLHENIYGVDLNSESVEITKLSLWLKTAQKGKKLEELKGNIKSGNSLINDPAVSGKAFEWKKEFEKIIIEGGFDVVIGNPPWGANIDTDAKWLGEHYPRSTKQVKDTYKIFIDKGLQLLRKNGHFGYIVPSTFLYQPRYQDVRSIIEEFQYGVVNLGEHIFEDVDLPCAILIVDKQNQKRFIEIDYTKKERDELPQLLSALNLQNEIDNETGATGLMKDTGLTLDDVFLMKDAGVKHQRTGVGMAEKGRSDIRDRLYANETTKQTHDFPLYVGSDINTYCILSKPSFFLRGNYRQLLQPNEIVYFDEKMMSAEKKIVWRQTSDRIRATLLGKEWFANTLQAAIIREKYQSEVNLLYGLAIFNSSYINFLYEKKVKESGRIFPQVKLAYLKPLPFVIADESAQQGIAQAVQEIVGAYVSLHKKTDSIHQLLRAEYGIEVVPRKLARLWTLSSDDFLKALKLKISLEKKQELMEYFEKQKAGLSYTADQIDALQKKIDEMVFDVYGLTEEEKNIVREKSSF